MDKQGLLSLLKQVKENEVSPEQAAELLKSMPFEDLGYAKVDHHRSLRSHSGEVIYCPGKATEHIKGIVKNMLERNAENIIATRAEASVYEAVKQITDNVEYYEMARIICINPKKHVLTDKKIAVVTGGTADIPVAEEAAVTAEILGNPVMRIYDVGVAGIHRLLSRTDQIRSANVVIAVAGMEGALASVVGGLVERPVIAVPTSVGYGAAFGGLSALLTMLNSCATGVGVVNIDNGFGAAYLASTINQG